MLMKWLWMNAERETLKSISVGSCWKYRRTQRARNSELLEMLILVKRLRRISINLLSIPQMLLIKFLLMLDWLIQMDLLMLIPILCNQQNMRIFSLLELAPILQQLDQFMLHTLKQALLNIMSWDTFMAKNLMQFMMDTHSFHFILELNTWPHSPTFITTSLTQETTWFLTMVSSQSSTSPDTVRLLLDLPRSTQDSKRVMDLLSGITIQDTTILSIMNTCWEMESIQKSLNLRENIELCQHYITLIIK